MIRANSSSKLAVLALVFCLAIALAPSAFGQAESGTVAGTVTDTTGAVVAGATVSIKNVATGAERTATTTNLGAYSVPGLAPGNYEVTVSKTGFASYRAKLEVTVGGHQSVDAQLAVGNQNTVVEVTAGGATEVNTQTQELSQLIDTQQLAQLPSLTRNPYDFVAISGNVSSGDRTAAGDDMGTTGRGVGFALNGQRTSGTEILLDGVENVDLFSAGIGALIPVDGVQEYRIVTNNFDAQYGRASGGVVNVISKGGTNSFHGSAWEFNRLAAYTANTYANSAANTLAGSEVAKKGEYTRNQFGFAVGGPIVKNKLFFYETTEWARVRSNATLQAYVPTPQFLSLLPSNVQNYFSKYGNKTFNFSSTLNKAQLVSGGNPIYNAGGPFDMLVPNGVPVLGLVNYSAPADAGGGVPQNTYDLVAKVDYNLGEKTQVSFRYARYSELDFLGGTYAGPYDGYDVGDSTKDDLYLLSLNHTFTPSVINTLKLSFSRISIVQTQNTSALTTPELFLSNGANVSGIAVQLPGLFAQFAGSGGAPYGGPQNVIQPIDDLSWIKGRHTMRFGGQFTYIQSNRAYGAYAQAIEQMGTNKAQGFDNWALGNLALFQAAIYPQGKFPCVRNPDGSLQVTAACTLTLPATSPSFSRSYRYKDWAIYAQDSFRITPRLTLNYGMRYEHYGTQHNGDPDLDSNFYYRSGSNIYEQIRNGSVQLAPHSPNGNMWNPRWGTVAPRIGFAYDIFGDGKTSLRGGWGISYERNFGNVTFNVIQNPPNYASVQLTPAILNAPIPVTSDNFGPFGGSNGQVPFRPSSLRHVNQNINVAQTQFRSLSLDRELARNTVLSVEYAGAHGVHLYDIAAFNSLGAGQAYLGDPLGPGYTRPNNQYSGINTRGSGGTSQYNAVNFKVQSNNLHNTGLSLVANYTWAHSTDDLSSTFSDSTGGASNGIGNLGYLDPNVPRLDWGSSDYDIRHRVALTAIWELPWYRSGRGVGRQALGGWTVVPVFSARTGTPFTVYDTSNSLNAGAGYGIPRYTPSSPVTSFNVGTPKLINGTANDFQVIELPPTVNWSNAALGGISDFGPYPSNMTGRNNFRGPGAWNMDFAISKSFAVTERVKLEFRAEGFNLFNHHNYYINALNFDAGAFGGGPIIIDELKGGLGLNNVSGQNHDERRFGQFALRVMF